MSIHTFPLRPVSFVPVDPYYQDTRDPAPLLRPMTALDQMYAYWGSDRLPDRLAD